MEPIVFGLIVVGYLGLRLFAARRVVARQGDFVWVSLVLPILAGAVTVLVGIQMLTTVPVAGLAMTAFGCLCFALTVRFGARLSRSVSSAPPEDDLGAATSESVVDYFASMAGLLLLGGLVAVLGIITWGIAQAVR